MSHREEYGAEVVPELRIEADGNDGDCEKLRPEPYDRNTEELLCGPTPFLSLKSALTGIKIIMFKYYRLGSECRPFLIGLAALGTFDGRLKHPCFLRTLDSLLTD